MRSHFIQNTPYFGGFFGGDLRKSLIIRKWLGRESNPRHEDFQSSALPTELPSRGGKRIVAGLAGASISAKKSQASSSRTIR